MIDERLRAWERWSSRAARRDGVQPRRQAHRRRTSRSPRRAGARRRRRRGASREVVRRRLHDGARAGETCRLAGLGEDAVVRELQEWHDGPYGGRTMAAIRDRSAPGGACGAVPSPGRRDTARRSVRAPIASSPSCGSSAGMPRLFPRALPARRTARWLGLDRRDACLRPRHGHHRRPRVRARDRGSALESVARIAFRGMESVALGESGLRVSRVGLGCNNFGGAWRRRDRAVVRRSSSPESRSSTRPTCTAGGGGALLGHPRRPP